MRTLSEQNTDPNKNQKWGYVLRRISKGRELFASFYEGFVEWVPDDSEACYFVRREDAEQLASESVDSIDYRPIRGR